MVTNCIYMADYDILELKQSLKGYTEPYNKNWPHSLIPAATRHGLICCPVLL